MKSLVYPAACPCCRAVIQEGNTVCGDCAKNLRSVTGERCVRCGREIYACTCRAGELSFERCVSPYRYDGSASKAVILYKMYDYTPGVVFLSDAVVKQIKEDYKDLSFDVVTSVPASLTRLIRYRFDHIGYLAETVAGKLGLPYKKLLKSKVMLTRQKSSGREKRYRNVYGKYRASGALDGETVLLIDDVMTTGATLNECSRALKKAGAGSVYCATFAITYKK